MFDFSKSTSQLWLFFEVKDKYFICIGMKNKKKAAHSLKKHKYL